MKKVILLILFFPYQASGQIFSDFENGTLSGWTQGSDEHWNTDTEGALNGNYSLKHVFDDAEAGSDCIGMPLTDLHPDEGTVTWDFIVKHGCDPSSSNNWSVFLMSDYDPRSFSNGSSVSGFAAGVNLSGYDDTLRLWKIREGSISVVASSPVNWQNDIGSGSAAKVHAVRNRTGTWTIEIYDDGNLLLGSASGTDPDLFNPAWLIINYRFTSTRDRLLWFDDLRIEGVFYEDLIPPSVAGYRVSGTNSLEIAFSEDPSDEILNPAVFTPGDAGNTIVRAIRRSPSLIEVIFRNDFINKKSNELLISNLCDRTGNCTKNLNIIFVPAWAEPGDIVISEIMADPVPSVALPEKEYLEIVNRTGFAFDLEGWKISSESQEGVFPETHIGPDEIMILCQVTDTSYFKKIGRVAGIKFFPSLTDEGRIIWLSDTSGNFMHGVEYSSRWYGDKLKEAGGWSLEMIDTDYPFFTEGNWEASLSLKGGTPGRINSSSGNNPDQVYYGIINVFPTDSITVSVSLSETTPEFADAPERILVDERKILSLFPADPLMREFSVHTESFLERGEIYSLFLTGDIRDFAGNEITIRSFSFGLPERASGREIVFNEILFNPFPEEPDFIEFFNCSEKVIDASTLWLASVSIFTGDTSEARPVSEEHRCIMPNSFYAVTTDRFRLLSRFPLSSAENIFQVHSLPSMPDDKGHLLLLNREMEVIDEVIYTDKMHYSLLSGREGVSLEKVRPEIISSESMSWHSASESSGWGTPGAANSVFNPASENGDRLRLSSGRVSPDNDGYEDVLVIDLETGGPGSVVTITVFDEKGGFVRRLRENFLAGEKASLVWDATADDGSLVSSGIYIIMIELFDDTGRKKSWKKVCTVIR